MPNVIVLNLNRDFTFEKEIFETIKEPKLYSDGVQEVDDLELPIYVERKISKGKITVSFSFVTNEDMDFGQIAKYMKKKTNDDEELEGSAGNVFWSFLRQSLVGCTGFGTSPETDIKIKENGVINIKAQKAVFQWLMTQHDLMSQIIEASKGITEKK